MALAAFVCVFLCVFLFVYVCVCICVCVCLAVNRLVVMKAPACLQLLLCKSQPSFLHCVLTTVSFARHGCGFAASG